MVGACGQGLEGGDASLTGGGERPINLFVAAEADGTGVPCASQRQTEEVNTLRVVHQLQL